MEDIRLEEVRSRAEAYYRTILDGIYAISHVDHGGRMDGYLAEQGRMARMAGFIIGFTDDEIKQDIAKRMGGENDD